MFQRFNSSKCKSACSAALVRIQILENKKEALKLARSREVAEHLKSGRTDQARIIVESYAREDNLIKAYQILKLYVSLLKERCDIIKRDKEMALDIRECLASLVHASTRAGEIKELQSIRGQILLKYGKQFISAASNDLVHDRGAPVNEKMQQYLMANPPDPQEKFKILCKIADMYGLTNEDWDREQAQGEFGGEEADDEFGDSEVVILPSDSNDQLVPSHTSDMTTQNNTDPVPQQPKDSLPAVPSSDPPPPPPIAATSSAPDIPPIPPAGLVDIKGQHNGAPSLNTAYKQGMGAAGQAGPSISEAAKFLPQDDVAGPYTDAMAATQQQHDQYEDLPSVPTGMSNAGVDSGTTKVDGVEMPPAPPVTRPAHYPPEQLPSVPTDDANPYKVKPEDYAAVQAAYDAAQGPPIKPDPNYLNAPAVPSAPPPAYDGLPSPPSGGFRPPSPPDDSVMDVKVGTGSDEQEAGGAVDDAEDIRRRLEALRKG